MDEPIINKGIICVKFPQITAVSHPIVMSLWSQPEIQLISRHQAG
ncbi:MAG: hypothetical protein KatS3mg057_0043 [Herpetosiphonaceae bacterium]|nr:MAG: hypothetical protein KatS3mg057_0043 [Herpetosiphonaceae bacterium]